MTDIIYLTNPTLTNADMNRLFTAAWADHHESDFAPVLNRSLVYIGAYAGDELVGFVNVAWDGGVHAFLLDTTVHPNYQRQGIGDRLVQEPNCVAFIGCMSIMHHTSKRFISSVASNRLLRV